MEGWRQERLGSRAGTHREKEKNKTSLQERKKRKTYLTLTGLLMEGLDAYDGVGETE
jgi:cytidylate kinase